MMYRYQGGYPKSHSARLGSFWLFIAGIIILFLVTTSISAHRKNTMLKNYALSLKKESSDITQENNLLKKQIESLAKDPVYQEAVIRKEFKMCLPGEIVLKDSD